MFLANWTELIEDNQHWYGFSFFCLHLDGEPRIQEPTKCTELRWMNGGEINELLEAGQLSIWAVRDWQGLLRLETKPNAIR